MDKQEHRLRDDEYIKLIAEVLSMLAATKKLQEKEKSRLLDSLVFNREYDITQAKLIEQIHDFNRGFYGDDLLED